MGRAGPDPPYPPYGLFVQKKNSFFLHPKKAPEGRGGTDKIAWLGDPDPLGGYFGRPLGYACFVYFALGCAPPKGARPNRFTLPPKPIASAATIWCRKGVPDRHCGGRNHPRLRDCNGLSATYSLTGTWVSHEVPIKEGRLHLTDLSGSIHLVIL